MFGRGLTVVALALVPAGVEWNVHGNAGHMQHMINPSGCTDRSSEVPFAGISGEITYRPPGKGGEWDHRTEARLSATALTGNIAPDPDSAARRDITIGYLRATIGWYSEYIGLRVGVYGGNVSTDQDPLVFLAASARVGSRKGFLRASIFDQEHCFPSDCLLGLEAGTHQVSLGGSVGLTSARVFARARVPGVIGGYDLTGGVFLGGGDEGSSAIGKNLVFSLGIGGHWDAAPLSLPPPGTSTTGPPGGQ